MTARVVHAVRLVVDRAQLDDADLLAEALDGALGHAVAASAATVLARRPDGTGVRVSIPEVRWHCPPAFVPTQEQTDRTADVVLAAVNRALASVGVLSGVLHRTPAVAERVAEAVDPGRMHRALRRYVVPSYEGGHAAIGVVSDDEAAITVTHVPFAQLWTPITLENFSDAWLANLAALGVTPPVTGLLGAIFNTVTGRMHVAGVRYPEGELAGTAFPIGPFTELVPGDNGNTEPAPSGKVKLVPRPVPLDPDSKYRLRWEGSGDPRPVITRFHGKSLAAKLREHVAQGPLMSDAEYQAVIHEQVAEALDEQVKAAKGADCFLRLVTDAGDLLLWVRKPYPDWVADGLDLELIPLTVDSDRPRLGLLGEGGTGVGRRKGAGRGVGTRRGGERGAGSGGEPGTGGKPGGAASGLPPGESGFVEGEGTVPGGSKFPVSPGGWESPPTQDCTPYLGEPKLDELGADATLLKRLVEQIAHALEMQPCGYVGSFLIDAGVFLSYRAKQVGFARELATGLPTAPAQGTRGNLGDLHFVPGASLQIQLMRHLAGVVPLISTLSDRYREALHDRPDLISGTWHNQYLSWELRFRSDLNSAVAEGVGQVFAYTSSILFGQLLRTSAATIEEALSALPRTAPVFEQRVLPMLAVVDDLIRWRDRIRQAEISAAMARSGMRSFEPAVVVPEVPMPPPPTGTGANRREAWMGGAAGVKSAMSSASRDRTRTAAGEEVGQVVHAGGQYRVRDDRGRLVTAEQLEQMIILTRGSAESIEPLVKHVDDLPDAVARMRAGGTAAVEAELKSLLERMRQHNLEITWQADADPTYGFTASAIWQDTPHATVPYSKYTLGGVHLLAHQEIGEFFRGDRYYPMGIDAVFDAELGKRALSGVGVFVGLVIVSVLCPPAGIVLGIEVAATGLIQAYERAHVYDALVDPDLVLSMAEVEAGLFAAWFGFVLSFLPVGAKLLGALRPAARAAAAGGEAVAGRAAASEAGAVAGTASLEVADAAAVTVREIESDFLEHFITELLKGEAINRSLELVMTPVMAHLQHELETTAAVGGMQRALALVLARQQAAARRDAPKGAK